VLAQWMYYLSSSSSLLAQRMSSHSVCLHRKTPVTQHKEHSRSSPIPARRALGTHSVPKQRPEARLKVTEGVDTTGIRYTCTLAVGRPPVAALYTEFRHHCPHTNHNRSPTYQPTTESWALAAMRHSPQRERLQASSGQDTHVLALHSTSLARSKLR
jgi:hypothetical protein